VRAYSARRRLERKYKNDRWNWDPLYLTLDFADGEQSIQLVTVGLPWKPRSAAPEMK